MHITMHYLRSITSSLNSVLIQLMNDHLHSWLYPFQIESHIYISITIIVWKVPKPQAPCEYRWHTSYHIDGVRLLCCAIYIIMLCFIYYICNFLKRTTVSMCRSGSRVCNSFFCWPRRFVDKNIIITDQFTYYWSINLFKFHIFLICYNNNIIIKLL